MGIVPGPLRRDVRLRSVYCLITPEICLHIFTVAASVILTQWRTRIRRQMNERDIVGVHDLSSFINSDAGIFARQLAVSIPIAYSTTKRLNTSAAKSTKENVTERRSENIKCWNIKWSVCISLKEGISRLNWWSRSISEPFELDPNLYHCKFNLHDSRELILLITCTIEIDCWTARRIADRRQTSRIQRKASRQRICQVHYLPCSG